MFKHLIIDQTLALPTKVNFCQAQPKPKPNHIWAVLVLNPTSPTSHPSMKLVLLKVVHLYKYTLKMISDLISMTKIAYLGPKYGHIGP